MFLCIATSALSRHPRCCQPQLRKAYQKGAKLHGTLKAKGEQYFVDVLTTAPFSAYFTKATAAKFYDHFRYGILHQAETKSSSKVRRNGQLVQWPTYRLQQTLIGGLLRPATIGLATRREQQHCAGTNMWLTSSGAHSSRTPYPISATESRAMLSRVPSHHHPGSACPPRWSMCYGVCSTLRSVTYSSVVSAASICARPSTCSSSGQAYLSCRSCLPTHSDVSTGGCELAFSILPRVYVIEPSTHIGDWYIIEESNLGN